MDSPIRSSMTLSATHVLHTDFINDTVKDKSHAHEFPVNCLYIGLEGLASTYSSPGEYRGWRYPVYLAYASHKIETHLS